jgi:hypothetical protein
MAEQRIYTCDECGAVKRDVNHWFKIVSTSDSLRLVSWNFELGGYEQDHLRVKHICGDACVTKAVAKFMTGIKRAGDERAALISAAIHGVGYSATYGAVD